MTVYLYTLRGFRLAALLLFLFIFISKFTNDDVFLPIDTIRLSGYKRHNDTIKLPFVVRVLIDIYLIKLCFLGMFKRSI
jgi:hypothetical protein